MSDIQLQNEREYNVQLEKKLNETQKELQESKEGTISLEEKYQEEIRQLKELLSESLGRERKLQELNAEAYSLLTLYGMQQVTTVQPYNMKNSKKDSESYAAALVAVATLSDPNNPSPTAPNKTQNGHPATTTNAPSSAAKGNSSLPTKSSSNTLLPNTNPNNVNNNAGGSKRPTSAIPTANVNSNSLNSTRPTTAAIPSTTIGGKK